MDVDVIMPTFTGRREWLIEAIDSVLGQTYPDWRLVVIDDGSPDDKESYVRERYGHDERIAVIRLDSNSGPMAAKTAGIEHGTSELIAFLDDDDRWRPEKLELQIERLQRTPDVHAVHTDVHYMDAEGRAIPEITDRQNTSRAVIDWDAMDAREQARSLFSVYPLKHSTSLIVRDAFERVGGYDLSLHDGADKELWVRFAALGNRVAHIPKPLYDRRMHTANISRTDRLKFIDDKLFTTEKLVSAFPFLHDLAKARNRRILRDAVIAGLEEGRGARTRSLVRQLRATGDRGSDLAGAWALSWLGPLGRSAARRYVRTR